MFTKSSGIDGLSVHFLKQVGNEISEALSLATNKSLSSGLVPSCLKEAKNIPLFKANNQTYFFMVITHSLYTFAIFGAILSSNDIL